MHTKWQLCDVCLLNRACKPLLTATFLATKLQKVDVEMAHMWQSKAHLVELHARSVQNLQGKKRPCKTKQLPFWCNTSFDFFQVLHAQNSAKMAKQTQASHVQCTTLMLTHLQGQLQRRPQVQQSCLQANITELHKNLDSNMIAALWILQ